MSKKTILISIIIIISSFILKSTLLFIIGAFILAYASFKRGKKQIRQMEKDNDTTNNVVKKHPEKKKDAIELINDKYLSNEFMQLYYDIAQEFATEKEYYDNGCCPYCGVVTEKKINTSKKCSSCKSYIWKRSNYITKQGYLLTNDRMKKYNDYEYKIKDLSFYEKLLKNKELLFDTDYDKARKILKDIINDYRYKYTSVRDIVWNFFQDYRMNYEKDAMSALNELIKEDDMIDRLGTYHVVKGNFFKSNRFARGMIDICKYNTHYDVALDLLARVTYDSQTVEFLYYGINEFSEIDHIAVYQECYPHDIIEFLKESNYDLDDFKQQYFRVNTLLGNSNLLTKENGWQYILDSIDWYKRVTKNW